MALALVLLVLVLVLVVVELHGLVEAVLGLVVGAGRVVGGVGDGGRVRGRGQTGGTLGAVPEVGTS